MKAADSIQVTVTRKQTEAQDICTFELVGAQGEPLPAFSAGSHIDVHLPGGPVRQYSLCNDPAENHRYLVGVLKDPASRGGSHAMHETISEGVMLTISAPKNHFPLAANAPRSLLLAGGIGVTPILCMAERLAVIGADFTMHYCTRSPARTAFRHRIAASSFAQRVTFHFDDGNPDQKLDINALLRAASADTHLYVCGPKGFMEAVLDTARARGWPEERLHYEFFSAEPVKLETDGTFEVKLASSGKVVCVAKDQTVVEALAAAGVEVQTSCEQGVCGTCLTRVISGEPDHRDMYLTPNEQAANNVFLPCCSRSKSGQLVLDL
ncbi:Phthalate 4,5-dioxygenase oxygenase reductase subunit [Paraburkholderia sediminicola]|uniref:Phthalate 4,5-dioxygenase oxygenase reductase subunit n=1 Tax=Paraburkholderia sediminicola TaxID=458836 RepID=A0A6J5CX75_9BURK|nr:PDR/VanB family oxidoreductase [Paraburkholderia sediminicola]CAB3745555.1 Phthalate 4,5-dioxygenase oxygenase reductase subunit [Paraburkholderia sediminicola]